MSDKKDDDEKPIDDLVTKRLKAREKSRRDNPNPLQQQALQNRKPTKKEKEITDR